MAKDELGISNATTTYDNRLIRLINAASDAIAQYCNRDFYWAFWSEMVRGPVARPPRWVLKRTPIAGLFGPNGGVLVNGVESVYEDYFVQPTLVPAENYDVEDLNRGYLYDTGRWLTTAIRRPDVIQAYDPGTEEAQNQVNYAAGYWTQPMIDALIGGQAWVAATAYHQGQLLVPSTSTGFLWQCTQWGTSGGSSPNFAGNTTKGTVLTDGTSTPPLAWTNLGAFPTTSTTTTLLGKTLPQSLEQACIDTVAAWFLRAGTSLDLQSERLGNAAQTYIAGGMSALPPAVKQNLMPWRRLL
jgi:hypothetical protein